MWEKTILLAKAPTIYLSSISFPEKFKMVIDFPLTKEYIDITRYGKKFGRLLVSLQFNPPSNQGPNYNSYQNTNGWNTKPNTWGNGPQQNSNWVHNNWGNSNWGNPNQANWNNQKPSWNQNPQQINNEWNSPTNYNISKNVYQNQNLNSNQSPRSNQNQGSLWGNVKPNLLTMGLLGQQGVNNYPVNNQQNPNNNWGGKNVNNGWGNGW